MFFFLSGFCLKGGKKGCFFVRVLLKRWEKGLFFCPGFA